MCFFQASVASVCIKSMIVPGLMANWCDSNHHNDEDEVEDAVLIRAKFHQYHEEIQYLREKSQ